MMIKVNETNIDQVVKLGLKLWPDNSFDDLKKDFENSVSSTEEELFLYEKTLGEYIGFIQLSLRNHYVEGCETSPVAYIEGIYVEDADRRSGIAAEMVRFAEAWGKEKGCVEIASDCELENTLSIDFHKGIGFDEANRLVCFVKPIKE